MNVIDFQGRMIIQAPYYLVKLIFSSSVDFKNSVENFLNQQFIFFLKISDIAFHQLNKF